MKARKVLGWFAPGDLDLIDISGRRTLTKQNEETFKRVARSLCDHFNATVTGVAYKSTQAEARGLMDDKLAKADALNKAGNPGKYFFG